MRYTEGMKKHTEKLREYREKRFLDRTFICLFFQTSHRPISSPSCSLLRAVEMQYHFHGVMGRAVNAKNPKKGRVKATWDRVQKRTGEKLV